LLLEVMAVTLLFKPGRLQGGTCFLKVEKLV